MAGYSLFVQTVPKIHRAKLIQQALALHIYYVIYVPDYENGITFICVVLITFNVSYNCLSVLKAQAESLANWAQNVSCIPFEVNVLHGKI